MSWWWLAPLGLSGGAAALLVALGRRLAAEAASAADSTAALVALRPRLIEARARLVIDVARAHPTETRPAHR
jgi:hypothetical protein